MPRFNASHPFAQRDRKVASRFTLSAFPSRMRARVNAELLGEFLLGDTPRLPAVRNPLGHGGTLRKRTEAEKAAHSRHVVDAELRVPLLPIDHGHHVAPDDFGESKVPQPTTSVPSFGEKTTDFYFVSIPSLPGQNRAMRPDVRGCFCEELPVHFPTQKSPTCSVR